MKRNVSVAVQHFFSSSPQPSMGLTMPKVPIHMSLMENTTPLDLSRTDFAFKVME
jgi:hypothetical protein